MNFAYIFKECLEPFFGVSAATVVDVDLVLFLGIVKSLYDFQRNAL